MSISVKPATEIKQPWLPVAGEFFAPRYNRPDSQPLGEYTVIASLWNTADPDEEGCYTAYVLALDPGTMLDAGVQYVVFDIACDVNDYRWVVDSEESFGSIRQASARYCDLSGDD